MSDSQKDTINISIDCLGGDNYPSAQIEGIKFFLKRNKNTNYNIKFLLYGEKDILESGLKRLSIPEKYYEIINVTKRVRSDEKPSVAMRNGKDSSMWLAIEAVKQGIANASVSAGNTGALMAISMLLLRTLQDVDRPALIQMLPTERNSSVAMLDMGANIIMLTPIFYPIISAAGIDPLQFCLLTVVVLSIGLVTPPVCVCTYICANIGNISPERVVKSSIPFLLSMLAVAFLIMFIPPITTWLPSL